MEYDLHLPINKLLKSLEIQRFAGILAEVHGRILIPELVELLQTGLTFLCS
jgi:hypothetical protein